MSPTNFIPSQIVFSNGQVTGNEWGTPGFIFLVDGDFATSDVNSGSASDFIIGNFNFNIPIGSIVTGIEIEIIGKRGAQTVPPISLTVEAYDNTNGANVFYPYTAPITTLTPAVSTIVIGSPTYLFSTTWTVDQINNFKLSLTANGDISLDDVLAKVYFTPPAEETLTYNTLVGVFQVGELITGTLSGATAIIVSDNGSSLMTVSNVTGFFQSGETITGGTSGATAILDTPVVGVCVDCSSPIQVQAMFLELPFLINQTKFYLKKGSFSYPDGTPVQVGDVGSCGGSIPFVFDESKRKANGQNFEENAMLDTSLGSWTVLASGVIEVDLGVVTQRGLNFKTPGTHVANLMSDHDANSKVIISNNTPYNLTLVRRCQVDTVFSPPITVEDEGVSLTTSLHMMNFVGAGVTTTLTALHEVEVNIPASALIVEDEGVPLLTAAGTLNFVGAGVTATGAGAVKTITIPGGSAGHVIQDNGVPLPAEPALNFVDFFTVTDNPGVSTDVDINVVELANDNTFITTLTSNVTFQTAVNSFVSGSGAVQIDQTPDNGTYGLLGGAVNGINTTFTVSTASYGIGKLQVYRNGLIQTQGVAADWTETTPAAGTFDFVVAPLAGDIITVVYSQTVGTPTDELVKISAADTTAGYLQPKLNIHSSDTSVTVTETITNPGANEILDIDLTGAGGGGAGLYTVNADETVATYFTNEIDLSYKVGGSSFTNGWIGEFTSTQLKNGVGVQYNGLSTNRTAVDLSPWYNDFNEGRIIRLKFSADVDPGIVNEAIAFGFTTSAPTGADFANVTDVNRCVKFLWKDVAGVFTLYTVTADGVTNTNNSTVAFTINNPNLYEIVWSPGVDAKFYVNGTLIFTHVTNLPTGASNIYLVLGSGSTAPNINLSKPIISIEQ